MRKAGSLVLALAVYLAGGGRTYAFDDVKDAAALRPALGAIGQEIKQIEATISREQNQRTAQAPATTAIGTPEGNYEAALEARKREAARKRRELQQLGLRPSGGELGSGGVQVRILSLPDHAQALSLSDNILCATSLDWGSIDSPTSRTVSCTDVSEPGSQSALPPIATPVHFQDISLVGKRDGAILYGTNLARDRLYGISLNDGGNVWNEIPLSEGARENGYVKNMFQIGDMLYIQHYGTLDVVDLQKQQLANSYSLGRMTTRIAFNGDYMAAMYVGLSMPVCDATGPTLTTYHLPGMEPLYAPRDIHGDCPRNLVVDNDQIIVVYANHIARFDLWTGQPLPERPMEIPSDDSLSDKVALNEKGLIVQSGLDGDLRLINRSATRECARISLLREELRFWPPLGQMEVTSPKDGRLYVAGFNDGTVSIVEGMSECP